MTIDINDRWRSGHPPFDGLTMLPGGDDLLPLSILRRALEVLIAQLRTRYPETELRSAEDWHQHDSFISEAKSLTWDEVRSWLTSEEALYAVGCLDSYVRKTLFPANLQFYLRFYAPDESDRDGRERVGGFDFTDSSDLVEEFSVVIREATSLAIITVPARQFFDERCSFPPDCSLDATASDSGSVSL